MGVKVYVSGLSGNKEVKKRQQRVLMILDSKNIKYSVVDITEPGKEEDKEFMQSNATSLGGTVSDPTPRHPLPPQIFNEADYCGDYDQFDMANEIDSLESFLKLSGAPASTTNNDSATAAEAAPAKEPETSEPEIANGNGTLEEEDEEEPASKEETSTVAADVDVAA